VTLRFDTVLVRFGEIAVKSPVVRRRMEDKLIDNLLHMLKRCGIGSTVLDREWGRIIIYTPHVDDVCRVACRCFGVTSVSPAVRTDLSLDSIRDTVIKLAQTVLAPGMRFAIEVNRANKRFPYTSLELKKILGSDVLSYVKGLKVDLERPDVTIYVEIRDRYAYVFKDFHEGPGGLPYGVEGRVVSLISGGVDSAVATWLVMKRGCEVIPIYCDLTPYTSEEARERARRVLQWLREWVPQDRWRLYVVPLGRAHEKVPNAGRYRCLLCKVLMYRVAEEVARRERAKAIVTGESIGQVASQTLDNLYFLSTSIRMPVIRPVVAMDKNEIGALARRIGVYDIAARDVIACKLVPKYPITHAKEKDRKVLEDFGIENLVELLVREMEVTEL